MSFVAESAIVLDVPEAEPLVGGWRARHDPIASRGIPAHITLLYPFVSPEQLDHDAIAKVRDVLAGAAPLDLVLSEVASFPGVVWLKPQPEAPLLQLIGRLRSNYPDLLPYGGKHPEPTPHLTVGQANDPDEFLDLHDRVRARLGPRLPLAFRATHAAIYISHEEHQWHRLDEFALGPPSPNGS